VNGNHTMSFLHKRMKVTVTVYRGKFGGWSYSVNVRNKCTYSATKYTTADEATLGAFDRVADLLGWET
jgi:hypothetical protein